VRSAVSETAAKHSMHSSLNSGLFWIIDYVLSQNWDSVDYLSLVYTNSKTGPILEKNGPILEKMDIE
jgi:hypothetical protein